MAANLHPDNLDRLLNRRGAVTDGRPPPCGGSRKAPCYTNADDVIWCCRRTRARRSRPHTVSPNESRPSQADQQQLPPRVQEPPPGYCFVRHFSFWRAGRDCGSSRLLGVTFGEVDDWSLATNRRGRIQRNLTQSCTSTSPSTHRSLNFPQQRARFPRDH